MRDLLLDVDPSRKQRSLEEALRAAIRSGRLKPGEAVPSSRGLAADLALARATVVAAYDQLVAEGYLASRPGALTRVAAGSWTAEEPVTRAPRLNYRLDLVPGEPDAARFPRAAWLRCAREVLATAPDDLFGYGDPSGLAQLRAELASYLNRTRNAIVAVDSTIVVPGAASGLSQVARLLHRQGATTIAVEEPGFPFHQAILRREGLRLASVPLDDEGIDVDALAATSSRAVVVTPAHQYPLGTVMSSGRRTSLVKWARERDAWIIEDDYDGEFRYDRRPVGALQGIAPDRVVYLGTSSKTLGAGLRIGWLVLPPSLRALMAEQRGRDADVSQLDQAILARFIAGGDLDRHVRRLRAIYRARRDKLLETLHSAIDHPDIQGVSAGLHLTVVLPVLVDEHDIVERALHDHRLALWGLRQHYQASDPVHGLVLGFSRTPTDFEDSLTSLAETLAATPSRGPRRPPQGAAVDG
jgi:GntR family transcriptional regulator/MocR family aminotransferase